MLDAGLSYITEEFSSKSVSPEHLDELLADGWRHFGSYFFRYNLAMHRGELRIVSPLRIRLSDLCLSKSQRRTLRRNADMRVEIGPLRITSEAEELFLKHRTRFSEGVPTSIYDFVAVSSDESPCDTHQLSVYESKRLVAESYFDVGLSAASGIYGMFDPELAGRRLGIFTLLKEIEFAIVSGLRHYYLGYTYSGPSFYDYKKRFSATEAFDWRGDWHPFFVNSEEHPAHEPLIWNP